MKYNLLILLSLLLASGETLAVKKVAFINQGITDDEIASSILPPQPPSTTKLIQVLNDKYNPEEIEELDLSGNTICVDGAIQILDFAQAHLPHLKKLDFSGNRIYEWQDTIKDETFEAKLKAVLLSPNFERIDLRLNGIANITWIHHIFDVLGANLGSKIIWNNSQVDE